MIFVAIASYRDPELEATMSSIFERASNPNDIRFGICQQDLPEKYIYRTGIKHFLPEESEGLGWARHETDKMYNNEEFFLQIDSHTEMVQNWDSILIDQYELASLQTARPIVLAAYPIPYKLDKLKKRILGQPGTIKTKIKFIEGTSLLKGEGICFNACMPVKARYINQGFTFGDGSFIRKVPHNPCLYFWAEEISMTVRAYTNGFELFHPSVHLSWHHYRRNNQQYQHWNPEDEMKRKIKAFERDKKSKFITTRLLLGELKGYDYGLGNDRTIEEFETYAGVNFKSRTLTDEAQSGNYID